VLAIEVGDESFLIPCSAFAAANPRTRKYEALMPKVVKRGVSTPGTRQCSAAAPSLPRVGLELESRKVRNGRNRVAFGPPGQPMGGEKASSFPHYRLVWDKIKTFLVNNTR
jgi:hypothetical protein